MSKRVDVKSIFEPALFWDAQDIDPKRHSQYIIARVLDYGDEKDLRRLREMYSDSHLLEVVQNRRGLLPMTRRFWTLYFGVSSKESR
ncbi:conserved hypothetical protein [delta proteobacterium NaphS2]|nr:conserved hypothetical protein [delta proteobacterium NaphS2]